MRKQRKQPTPHISQERELQSETHPGPMVRQGQHWGPRQGDPVPGCGRSEWAQPPALGGPATEPWWGAQLYLGHPGRQIRFFSPLPASRFWIWGARSACAGRRWHPRTVQCERTRSAGCAWPGGAGHGPRSEWARPPPRKHPNARNMQECFLSENSNQYYLDLKGWSTDITPAADGSWGHYAKEGGPDSGHTLHDSISVRPLEESESQGQRVARARGWGGGGISLGTVSVWGDGQAWRCWRGCRMAGSMYLTPLKFKTFKND